MEELKKILIIEDEPVIASDIQNKLEGLGYSVSAVISSGEKAVEKAGELMPDLVLMDIALDGSMDGIEAAGQIREQFDIPFVYLTAYADDKLLERAKTTEAFGYMIKPFQERELHAVIELALYKCQMEKKLRESEERYRLLAENAADVIWTMDMNLRYTYVSPSIYGLMGYTPEELLDITLDRIFPPASLELCHKTFEENLALEASGRTDPNRTHMLELEQIRKDGSVIWAEVKMSGLRDRDGRWNGMLGVSRDITDRKLAEKSLRQSEERYRNFFEASKDAVYITSVDGKFIDINDYGLELFGIKRDDLDKIDVAKDIYADPADRATFTEILSRKGYATSHRVNLKRMDGTTFPVTITTVAVKDAEGNITGYQSIIRDETERKRLETQFQQAQKMEAVGTLAGGIAHDFNNLLTAIQGNASLILMQVDPGKPEYERLSNIEECVKSGADLTRQLLGFARGGAYDVKPTNLNDLVQKTSDMFGRTKKESFMRSIWMSCGLRR